MELYVRDCKMDDRRGTPNTENTGQALGQLATVLEGSRWAVVGGKDGRGSPPWEVNSGTVT